MVYIHAAVYWPECMTMGYVVCQKTVFLSLRFSPLTFGWYENDANTTSNDIWQSN